MRRSDRLWDADQPEDFHWRRTAHGEEEDARTSRCANGACRTANKLKATSRCGACKRVKYCSKACQQAHWVGETNRVTTSFIRAGAAAETFTPVRDPLRSHKPRCRAWKRREALAPILRLPQRRGCRVENFDLKSRRRTANQNVRN